jgi:small GTP-binding protein
MRKRSSGLFLLVAAAVIGYCLIALPPAISQSYESIYRVNPRLAFAYLCVVAALAAIVTGLLAVKTVQMWRRSRKKHRPSKRPSDMSPQQIRKEIAERQQQAADFLSSVPDGAEREQLVRRLEQERTKMEEQTLEIAAFGTISSGKSSLLNALIGRPVFVTDARGGTTAQRNESVWPGQGKVRLVDTPGLGEMHGADRATAAIESARSADLILYVTDGVLRQFEFDVLRRLAAIDKRIVVCLNKADTFTTQDREKLLDQMRAQLKTVAPARDFVAVRASPATRTRVRVTVSGEEVEETVTLEPDVSAVADRMLDILDKEGSRLLLANLLVRARGLIAETRDRVRAQLEKEARELVGRYMWQAGGAAALSPFPLLDIAAGLGISYKMVIDIAAVFRQPMDLDSAREMVAQAGKNLVASAGVAVATPSVASLAASALKTIPGIGTVAGGLLQGLVQALVTRWIGLVFIDYFRNEMKDAEQAIPELAKSKWNEVTRPAELARLLQEGMRKLNERNNAD